MDPSLILKYLQVALILLHSFATAQNNTSSDGHNGDTDDASNSKKILSMVLILALVICLIAIAMLFFMYRKKDTQLNKILKQISSKEVDTRESAERKKDIEIERTEEIREQKKEIVEERGKLVFTEEREERFELGDLLKASAEELGKGIFGTTYKAMLEGKPGVVVKRLRDLKPMSADDFTKKIRLLSELRHPNLLPLLAYYCAKDEKLFLYKYAENGNLFTRIHEGRGLRNRIPFPWRSRMSIARGVAQALEYLHRNTEPGNTIIPHGNLKSLNVLLNEKDEVLVSDYGFASLLAHPVAYQRMIAYKSPEYRQMKEVSKKSDVWSYGCLLFELLTGKISSYSAPPGFRGIELCSWVARSVREEWTAEIFDLEISVQRSATPGMLRLLQIGIRCSDNSPEKRPEMSEVVREIESIKVPDNEDDLSSELSLTDESVSTTASGN